jgi:hypothetical protein
MSKSVNASKSQDSTPSFLTELLEKFLPEFIEGEPNLPQNVEKWLEERLAKANQWSKIAARRQRRAQTLGSA